VYKKVGNRYFTLQRFLEIISRFF